MLSGIYNKDINLNDYSNIVFEKPENKSEIVDFVKRQIDNTSSKRRNTAKEFLRIFGETD